MQGNDGPRRLLHNKEERQRQAGETESPSRPAPIALPESRLRTVISSSKHTLIILQAVANQQLVHAWIVRALLPCRITRLRNDTKRARPTFLSFSSPSVLRSFATFEVSSIVNCVEDSYSSLTAALTRRHHGHRSRPEAASANQISSGIQPESRHEKGQH